MYKGRAPYTNVVQCVDWRDQSQYGELVFNHPTAEEYIYCQLKPLSEFNTFFTLPLSSIFSSLLLSAIMHVFALTFDRFYLLKKLVEINRATKGDTRMKVNNLYIIYDLLLLCDVTIILFKDLHKAYVTLYRLFTYSIYIYLNCQHM